jgi:prepilin-type N-terminal cleavage/methylation domain-containing protein
MQSILWNQRGMSLAEILIASVIMAVGLVALLSAIPLASYAIGEGTQLSTATFLANQRLEQVKNAQWTATPVVDLLGVSASMAVAPKTGVTTTFPDETPLTAPFTGYTRQVRVTDCGVAPGCVGVTNAGLRQVTVIVSYQPLTGVGTAATGTTKSMMIQTLITEQ